MDKGLLHLHDVRTVVPREDFLERNLALAIREATKTDHGRMITLEDEAHRLLSFYPIDFGKAIVRVANVDDKGKPFASRGFAPSLYLTVYKRMGTLADVHTSGALFDHHYHPGVFGDTDFLYVPDNEYILNMLVVLHHARKK